MKVRRPLLLPLTSLYAAALALKRRLFAWGWLKRSRLKSPVISVGSVSAGGAGKTPVVLSCGYSAASGLCGEDSDARV